MNLKFLIIFWGLLIFLGFTGASYAVTADAPSSQPATREQFGEVAQVDPDLQAWLVGGVIAICNKDGSIHEVLVLHDTSIQTLLFVQQKEAAYIPQGELLEGPDADQRDMPRSLGLQAITMAKSDIVSVKVTWSLLKKTFNIINAVAWQVYSVCWSG
jgi:hypothetical protein